MDAARTSIPDGGLFHGRYEIVRCIKSGGMGTVYEVLDQTTRRRRALKLMLPEIVKDADLRARFKLEATITADVESEHIVETLDAGVDAATGSLFVVMELLRGEDLGATLQRRGPLPAGELSMLLHQTALALDKTHAAGIVHRDLKPENLFVTKGDDGSPRIKVLDFGIAKVVAESGGTNVTRAMGTPPYMPPEQIRGDGRIGPRADLYALGHIAYTLLVGEAYWEEEGRALGSYAFCSRILAGATEAASARAMRRKQVTLPAGFDGWFAKATALAQEARFEVATAQIAALGDVLGIVPPRPSPSASPATVRIAPISEATCLSPAAPIAGAEDVAAAHRGTADPVSSERPVAPSARSRMPWIVGALGVATLGILVGVFGARRTGSGEPSFAAPTGAASAEPAIATTAAPSMSSVVDAPIVQAARPASAPTPGGTSAPARSVGARVPPVTSPKPTPTAPRTDAPSSSSPAPAGTGVPPPDSGNLMRRRL